MTGNEMTFTTGLWRTVEEAASDGGRRGAEGERDGRRREEERRGDELEKQCWTM